MKNSCLWKSMIVGIVIVLVEAGVVSAFNKNVPLDSEPLNHGVIFYVGGSGPGNYTKIQDAIDNASDGDTVFVYPGLYIELLVINCSIDLIGADNNFTIIDGNDTFMESTITINKDNVSITDFTIQNGSNSGVRIYTSNNTISNNIITGNGCGIRVSSDYKKIKDNLICYNQIINNRGYSIDSDGNVIRITISHNIIRNSRLGMEVDGYDYIISNNFFENTSNMTLYSVANFNIENNVFTSSGFIYLMNSNWIKFNNNTFTDSQGIKIFGSTIDYWDTHTIENNTINEKPIYYYQHKSGVTVPSDAAEVILVGCTSCVIDNIIFPVGVGIQLAYSSSNSIFGNTITKTTGLESGIYLQASSNNNISYNSISDCEFGMYLDFDSSNNNMYRNIIKNNIVVGVFCVGSSNTFVENHIADNYFGMGFVWASDTIIRKNNFVNNLFHALFLLGYWNKHSNKWQSNFYSPQIPRVIKIIFGAVRTPYYYLEGPSHGQYKVYLFRPGFNIDWRPAREPYDIPGMR